MREQQMNSPVSKIARRAVLRGAGVTVALPWLESFAAGVLVLGQRPLGVVQQRLGIEVVPGHGRISDYGEVVEYRDMVTVVKDTIHALIEKGLTLEQVKAADPTKGYRGRYGSDTGTWTTDMFVEAVYNGLSGK